VSNNELSTSLSKRVSVTTARSYRNLPSTPRCPGNRCSFLATAQPVLSLARTNSRQASPISLNKPVIEASIGTICAHCAIVNKDSIIGADIV